MRVVVLAVASIVTLLPGCEGAGKVVSERENLRLLAMIPTYPGSQVVDTRTSARYEEGVDLPEPFLRTVGYVTTSTVAVPRGTRMRDVLRFFRSALSGWRCSVWFDTLPPPHRTAAYMNCRRDGARFGLGTEDLLPAARFEVSMAARSPP